MNAIGAINALRADNEIIYGWYSCPTCLKVTKYDVRHELLECSHNENNETGITDNSRTAIVNSLRDIMRLLQHGLNDDYANGQNDDYDGEGDAPVRRPLPDVHRPLPVEVAAGTIGAAGDERAGVDRAVGEEELALAVRLLRLGRADV